jgi:hypothetical protein
MPSSVLTGRLGELLAPVKTVAMQFLIGEAAATPLLASLL